jgi:hypothetical protein
MSNTGGLTRTSVQQRSRPIRRCRWVGVNAIPRSPAFWLRSTLSLALAVAILAVALPVAFGGGAWNGGVDPSQFF